MLEQIRRDRFKLGPDPSSPSEGGGTAVAEREPEVQVFHGVHSHSYPIVGMTIAQARAELEDRLNIDPGAVANVNGVTVPADFILREGQVLQFVKPSGEKG